MLVLPVCGHRFSRQAAELPTHTGPSQQLATQGCFSQSPHSHLLPRFWRPVNWADACIPVGAQLLQGVQHPPLRSREPRPTGEAAAPWRTSSLLLDLQGRSSGRPLGGCGENTSHSFLKDSRPRKPDMADLSIRLLGHIQQSSVNPPVLLPTAKGGPRKQRPRPCCAPGEGCTVTREDGPDEI